MPIRDLVLDMEVELEQNVERYVLYDMSDTETQEEFVRDLFGLEGDQAKVERIVEHPKVQDCFSRLQELINDHRYQVLVAYAESEDIPKQFRRDVL